MDEEFECPRAGLSAVFSAATSAATMVATNVSRGCGVSNASNMTVSRSLGIESTRLLFMGDSFRERCSEQDVFYDCEDSPREGRSATSRPSRCNLDDPAAMREILERAANATTMLLKNFDKTGGGGGWNTPCAVTLEVTARLVDPKKSRAGCPLHGKPVTVQMPLQFNPQSGKISSCQQRKAAPQKTRKAPICQCRSQLPLRAAPVPPKPNSGKSASDLFLACESKLADSMFADRSRSSGFVGSCGDSTSRSFHCHPTTCRQRFDPEAREVISICYLPVPEPISEPEEEVVFVKEVEEPVVEPPIPTHLNIAGPEPETESEPETETESEESSEEEAEKVEEPEPEPEPETPVKRYFLALPQNKDFSNCSPCRYDPSPIMDEEGNVFCPGNCGCCMCPWLKRSLATNWQHTNVKVCRCVQRGTIFTNFDDREVCSQGSYFDFCPCREKAEAKFLELYHREMWTRPHGTRGREIKLSEIKELLVPITQANE